MRASQTRLRSRCAPRFTAAPGVSAMGQGSPAVGPVHQQLKSVENRQSDICEDLSRVTTCVRHILPASVGTDIPGGLW